jgi:hypothetical protein
MPRIMIVINKLCFLPEEGAQSIDDEMFLYNKTSLFLRFILIIFFVSGSLISDRFPSLVQE